MQLEFFFEIIISIFLFFLSQINIWKGYLKIDPIRNFNIL